MLSLFKQRSPSPVRSDRERLRTAIADRGQAQQAFEDAQSTIERIEAVIDAAGNASSRAQVADSEAKAGLATWARRGCAPEQEAEHQRLRTVADEAQRVAEHARDAAEEAQKSFPQAQSAVEQARSDRKSALDRINEAVGVILASEIAPELEQFEALAAEYRRARLRILALANLISPWTYDARHAREEEAHGSREGYGAIAATLKRAIILSPDDETFHSDDGGTRVRLELNRQSMVWRARAKSLQRDSDA